MTEKELIKKLKTLGEISPDEHYARTSRLAIVSQDTGLAITKQNPLTRSLGFVASVSLAVTFMLLLSIGGITGFHKNLFLSDLEVLEGDALSVEAYTVSRDINIRLNKISYFKDTDSVVIANVYQGLTPETIKSGEEKIDNLLEKIISY